VNILYGIETVYAKRAFAYHMFIFLSGSIFQIGIQHGIPFSAAEHSLGFDLCRYLSVPIELITLFSGKLNLQRGLLFFYPNAIRE
jgi:hypothetical protein